MKVTPKRPNPNPPSDRELALWIEKFNTTNGFSPSVREIADFCDCSVNLAHTRLNRLVGMRVVEIVVPVQRRVLRVDLTKLVKG